MSSNKGWKGGYGYQPTYDGSRVYGIGLLDIPYMDKNRE